MDNELCKCGKVGKISCPNDERCGAVNAPPDVQFDAEHMSLVFLSEVEKIMDRQGMRKTDLAQMLNTSKSYLTQLWRGDKVLSLQMIARIQIALNVKFTIKAHDQG